MAVITIHIKWLGRWVHQR